MIVLKNISKQYNKQQEPVIDRVNLKISDAGLTCITGESGSGKTTLLNIISLIEKPTNGEIEIDGIFPNTFYKIRELRKSFGYIFQNYGLVEDETVKQNLDLGTKFVNFNKAERKKNYRLVLQKVNLDPNILAQKIYTLSGGEQQRVALARVLLLNPKYIFADEPTGNLDEKNRDAVFEMLKTLAIENRSVVYVSHDPDLIKQADTVIELKR